MNRFFAGILAAALLLGSAPALAQDTSSQQQWEQQIGQQEYQHLRQQGVIIDNSPYYNILGPIAARIKRTADPQYDFPFHFILVHDKSPNAFAVPGGNVYVTDSMMTFAKSKEELAGVLCHETAHDIHHDVYALAVKQQRTAIIANIADLLLGGGRSGIANFLIGLGYNLQSLKFTRTVEHNADYKGAITCAQAGLNPWGMVWLFNAFEAHPHGAPPEALSDHPRDDHRISDLENEFSATPSLFGCYNPNESSATPIDSSNFRNQYRSACSTFRQAARPAAYRRVVHHTAKRYKGCTKTWKYCH